MLLYNCRGCMATSLVVGCGQNPRYPLTIASTIILAARLPLYVYSLVKHGAGRRSLFPSISNPVTTDSGDSCKSISFGIFIPSVYSQVLNVPIGMTRNSGFWRQHQWASRHRLSNTENLGRFYDCLPLWLTTMMIDTHLLILRTRGAKIRSVLC